MTTASELIAQIGVETVPPAVPETGSSIESLISVLGPILSTGVIGSLFLMILFRIKIMPTYVFDAAKDEWDKERDRLDKDIVDLKAALVTANDVYIQQVIPTLTRVLDAERELVELRRDEAAERRRRGQ